MIKTDLLVFGVTMHLSLCEQYIKALGLTASGCDFPLAHAFLHCDNKPLQNWFWSLKQGSEDRLDHDIDQNSNS